MNGILAAITAALTAYSSWVRWQIETSLDKIEDEIDSLAGNTDATSKLRILRLKQRHQRKRESIGALRSPNGDAAPPRAIPVSGGDADGTGPDVPL